ncbi:MAG: FtsH protease activity modulator HflK [Deltaproteobacteria bacterium]|nr:FtsH protease activity modulator HflK [Deltaproteobacteria bacterium]
MERFQPGQEQNPLREFQRTIEEIRERLNRFMKGWGFSALGLVVLGLYIGSGLYVVGPGEKAVVLLFGKESSIAEPGLRYRLPKPFMNQIIVDVSKVRRAEIGFRSDGTRTRSVPAESLMLTGDENIVDVQLFVQYMVQDPVKFLFGAEAPENTLKASAEVALRGVIGENTIDYTMTSGRMEIQKKVELYLQRLLNNYNTGLLVTQARLLVVDPPAQVQDAFHDVVRAWEDRERLIKEADGYSEDIIPKARGLAQQEIRQAEAYKAERVIRAKGDVERFSLVLAEYSKAPKVTRERLYLESAEKFFVPTRKLIMDTGDSKVIPFLNISDPEKIFQHDISGNQESSAAKNKKGQ